MIGSTDYGPFIKLLSVITDEERRSLLQIVGVAESCAESEFLEAIQRMPRYAVVRAYLRALSPTLEMLQDVVTILEKFDVRVRTTGAVFILADPASPGSRTEMQLSQQMVGVLSSWNNGALAEGTSTRLRDLWQSIQGPLRNLVSRAYPLVRKGQIDMLESSFSKKLTYKSDVDLTDYDARAVLRFFTERLDQLARKFPVGREPIMDSYMTRVMLDVRAVVSRANDMLMLSPQTQWRRDEERGHPAAETIQQKAGYSFAADFDQFMEHAYLMADLLEGRGATDLLRLDHWKTRPQLYEMWLLLTLANWLTGRGYRVSLREVGIEANGPSKWNLSYAMSRRPCAEVVHGAKRQLLFYQLRRGQDMPDIALLDGDDSTATPIWCIDAKHSERSGYGLNSYRRTALKYRDSFGARLSLVAEHFPRADLGDGVELVFGEGAVLLREVRPGGRGLDLLFRRLSTAHPRVGQQLVCVDLSDSYRQTLPKAIARERDGMEMLSHEGSLFDQLLCFSGTAKLYQGVLQHIDCVESLTQDLKPGTCAAPLLASIEAVLKDGSVTDVLLLSDCEFDMPKEEFLACVNRLGAKARIVC